MSATPDGRCAIAIVGCAGRFPGAADVPAFWKNLCDGVESIRRFSDGELEDGVDAGVRASDDFVKARGIVDGVDLFDAGFFGMHAREAETTDPQHRVFLECCWHALEDAGCDPATYAGTIGIYAGASLGSYLLRNVLPDRAAVERFTREYQAGSVSELIGSGYDFLATRVAYKLDLRGPAMSVQSACSTSLLAVAQACQALLARQADVMLAGGVSITFPQKRGYRYEEGGMVSPDGRCRTFDADASGTVFGDGAAVVALKRLDDALADGDAIYAVIRGFGISNDGSRKVGYTAPSAEGQAEAMRAAYAMAGIDPQSIGFCECHGTATPLGDPIEIAALTRSFGPGGAAGSCALGSLKPNVGHLDVASGAAGLIKAALAVRSGVVPPTLHYKETNPEIELACTPFFVNSEARAWPGDARVRRAAVSSFGLGGTNVHVVLEAPPAASVAETSGAPQLLVLSARSEAALDSARAALAARLRQEPATKLADVAHTLQTGRRAFPFRSAVAAATVAEAAATLERRDGGASGRAGHDAPPVAFMFPGQGAQYLGMGRELYLRVPAFRATIDRCADLLQPAIGRDLSALLYGEGDPQTLTSTELAQPALFAVEYALAELLRGYGVEPVASVGHSVGEFVSATLAGVFSLEDALALVAERGRLIRELAPGAMLAVRAPEEEVAAFLEGPLDFAAFNAPALTVVSGPFDAIERLERNLSENNVASRRLQTSHAFHSAMMDPALAALQERVARSRPGSPSLPFVSATTGTWITPEEARSPAYWAQHCRRPVRFADTIRTLVDAGVQTLLEVGPGATLATFALQGAAKGRAAVLRTLPSSERERPDGEMLLETLGALWTQGVRIDWDALHAGAPRSRVSLPGYPFERARYWIEPPGLQPVESAAAASVQPPSSPQENVRMEQPPPDSNGVARGGSRGARIERELVALLEDLSGENLSGAPAGASFLELGFDSLFLGRVVQQVRARFGVAVTFRQLLGDIPTIGALVACIERDSAWDEGGVAAIASIAQGDGASGAAGGDGPIEALFREQLQAMQQLVREQLDAVRRLGSQAPPAANATAPADSAAPSRFEAFRIAPSSGSELSEPQRAHVDELVARTVARTGESKRLTQRYRTVLADPRVAAGFRSEWKEMVYPITCVRAKGARLWDVDGNEYIDLLNGFGQTAFGHSPDFVNEAVAAQLERGFAIGPQTDLAGEVAELFCEITGNERMTFCNTGSEAVMAALRVARTVTGRDRVVLFEGSYHGQFDEVLVKSASTSRRSLPVALGIPSEAVANVTVLPYGTPESLAWIREHAAGLAAVVVETVQSRHPALRPVEFLAELRRITLDSGSALVFDEVVTGFRMHPGGMQAVFGIRADLATYGKVVGGGLPIGILAGTARFMDALDGGAWQFGDDSFPQVAPTFFAGTFVRHPLVMAAVLAVLRHVKASGAELQETIARRTATLVGRLNSELEGRGIATRIETYSSLFYLNFAGEDRLASLLFYHMRLRGVYLQEGFPCFLTTEHDDADVETIVTAFAQSLDELRAAGILAGSARRDATSAPLAEVPLTEEQTEVWLAAQVSDEASCAFNESVTLRLRGPFDEKAWAAAWSGVVARHDSLRASFGSTGETMRAGTSAPFVWSAEDFSTQAPDAREAALRALVRSDARSPFDLAAGPLVRGCLARMAPDEHAFVFTAHHIVCDGWSMNVVLSEVAALYEAARRGVKAALPEPLAFATYASRPRDPRASARNEAYWLEQFAEVPAPLELPADRPRPALKSFRGNTLTAHVARDAYLALKKSAARSGRTLFATLLGAFEILAGRLSDRSDVVVGVPAAGQALLEDEILVGHCVDFLPLRARWDAATSIEDLLAGVKQHVLDAYEHQEYTLGTLVRKLAPQREANRTPLAEIQFNLERLAEDLPFESLSVTVEPNPKAFVNFDLFFNVVESGDGLRIDCDYNSDLFDAATIERWLVYYRAILDAIERDPAQRVTEFDYFAESDGDVLAALNATAAAYPRELTLAELFDRTVARHGGATALRFGGESLSYAELQRRAELVAARLPAHAGSPGRRVAVCVERSFELVVALLGTLKAGCTYVPLDASHPPARLRRMLEDADVAVLLSDRAVDPAMLPAGLGVVNLLDAAPETNSPGVTLAARALPDDAAYLIYTSGSTGAPKGVAVSQRNLVNALSSFARSLQLAPGDELLAVTTVSFDIAALELFLPLVCGATVRIASRAECADPFALVELLRTSATNVLQATPSLWSMLLEAGFRSETGFTMLCGGEALSFELAQRLMAGGGALWNVYGPTETTIWSSSAQVVAGSAPITVGKPIANTQLYVLDRNDRRVPIGVTGQLHIAGDGVALGYAGRPDLSAEKFVPNPFGEGRMYRTGDAARVLASGEVQVLGRLDHQLKLRGHRIEPAEIEAAVIACGAAAATVVLREDAPGERRLVCYYVPGTLALGEDALRAAVARELPDYMVPALWVALERLPLSAAGKVDRAALPAPAAPEPASFRPPETATESALAEIWANVLNLERVGRDDDFLALGGDSIQLFQITARANRSGLAVAAKQLLEHRTVAALARHLDENPQAVPAPASSLPPFAFRRPGAVAGR